MKALRKASPRRRRRRELLSNLVEVVSEHDHVSGEPEILRPEMLRLPTVDQHFLVDG
jgi:hypothetical protein